MSTAKAHATACTGVLTLKHQFPSPVVTVFARQRRRNLRTTSPGHCFLSAQTFTDSGDRHQIASYSTFEQLDGVGWASLWVRDQIASGAKNPLKLSLISHKYGKYGTNIEWDERTSPFSPYI